MSPPLAVVATVLAACAAAFCWMTWRANQRIRQLDQQLAKALGIIGERDDTLREYDDRNARLHHDMQALRDRLPSLIATWGGSVPAPELQDFDQDPTRGYIPDYEAWKDGLR